MSNTPEIILPAARTERAQPYKPPALAGSDAATLMAIVERAATAPDFNIDRIRQLLELKERWDASEREKAFNEAMAAFKQQPPQVFADKVNKQYGSNYSSLGNFSHIVNAALGEHGLEASWEIEQGRRLR
jgi:hypothetical protein